MDLGAAVEVRVEADATWFAAFLGSLAVAGATMRRGARRGSPFSIATACEAATFEGIAAGRLVTRCGVGCHWYDAGWTSPSPVEAD